MMKIGRNMLTLTAMAALSVGTVFAQGTVSKPAKASNPPMASKMAEDQPTPQSGQKKMDKHVHGHHHKNKKHTSNTSTQDTTTKK
jgi:Spy/CpxP family protein refolding chaperone